MGVAQYTKISPQSHELWIKVLIVFEGQIKAGIKTRHGGERGSSARMTTFAVAAATAPVTFADILDLFGNYEKLAHFIVKTPFLTK